MYKKVNRIRRLDAFGFILITLYICTTYQERRRDMAR